MRNSTGTGFVSTWIEVHHGAAQEFVEAGAIWMLDDVETTE
jgi:hypothetical protein